MYFQHLTIATLIVQSTPIGERKHLQGVFRQADTGSTVVEVIGRCWKRKRAKVVGCLVICHVKLDPRAARAWNSKCHHDASGRLKAKRL